MIVSLKILVVAKISAAGGRWLPSRFERPQTPIPLLQHCYVGFLKDTQWRSSSRTVTRLRYEMAIVVVCDSTTRWPRGAGRKQPNESIDRYGRLAAAGQRRRADPELVGPRR